MHDFGMCGWSHGQFGWRQYWSTVLRRWRCHVAHNRAASAVVVRFPWKYNNFYAVHRTTQVQPMSHARFPDAISSWLSSVGRRWGPDRGSARPPDLDWYAGRRRAYSMRLICIHARDGYWTSFSAKSTRGVRAWPGRSSLIDGTFTIVWSMVCLLRLFGVRRRRLSVFRHICASVATAVYHVGVVVADRCESLWLPTQLHLYGNSNKEVHACTASTFLLLAVISL